MSSTLDDDAAFVAALARGDEAALARFDAEIVPDISGALFRMHRGDDFVDEIVQRVRVKLLVSENGTPPRISQYRGTGRLAAWVQIVAIREALMYLRGGARTIASDDDLVRIALTDPMLARSRERYREPFARAFREALAALPKRERTWLQMCFLEGVSTQELARLYRVHRVTALRWLRDARSTLLEATRERFVAAVDIPDSQVSSLMRSLAASLSVSW
jgi:RNA polymerase sigma-70 factor (ECF subfamily)